MEQSLNYRNHLLFFLLLIPGSALAVDGVGLFEMFPFLGKLFFLFFLAIAVLVALWGFTKIKEGTISSIKAAISLIICAALIGPFIYSQALSLLSKHYKDELCSSKAYTRVIIFPEEWSPNKPRNIYPDYESLPNNESRTHVAGNIFEYRRVTHYKYGTWGDSYRFVDESTGQLLMHTNAYYNTRISRPYGCGGNEKYWRQRDLFQSKAWDFDKE